MKGILSKPLGWVLQKQLRDEDLCGREEKEEDKEEEEEKKRFTKCHLHIFFYTL